MFKSKKLIPFVLALSLCVTPFTTQEQISVSAATTKASTAIQIKKGVKVPQYKNDAYVNVNKGVPFFTKKEKTNTRPFESYSKLDKLGRCGVAYANVCRKLQPTEERGQIGSVKPSGWQTVKYPGIVDGNYLYNRCHLIGYQLAGENANKKNLITGTRYLNITGMLPFENKVDDYLEKYNRHVLYRVTPVFTGNNLVADGVLMEGYSVEDKGKGIQFCIFVYNSQPGIIIDYSTGQSRKESDKQKKKAKVIKNPVWIPKSGKKYHTKSTCGAMKNGTKIDKANAKKQGYTACSKCA